MLPSSSGIAAPALSALASAVVGGAFMLVFRPDWRDFCAHPDVSEFPGFPFNVMMFARNALSSLRKMEWTLLAAA